MSEEIPQARSSRRLDTVLEQSVARFMDEFFYSKLSDELGIPCRRVDDVEEQILGVDVVLGKFNIDEKVKVKGGYVSKVIQFPSFELSFVSQRTVEIVDGWLVREGLKTDYYALISVFSKESDWKRIRFENIDSLVALFVNKNSLLERIGLDSTELRTKSEELRSLFPFDDRLNLRGCHLKLSMQYPEQPVNLVMNRDILKELPHTKEVEIGRNSFRAII